MRQCTKMHQIFFRLFWFYRTRESWTYYCTHSFVRLGVVRSASSEQGSMCTPIFPRTENHFMNQWRIQYFVEGVRQTLKTCSHTGRRIRQPTIWPIFPENCKKMKIFWPRGGVGLYFTASSLSSYAFRLQSDLMIVVVNIGVIHTCFEFLWNFILQNRQISLLLFLLPVTGRYIRPENHFIGRLKRINSGLARLSRQCTIIKLNLVWSLIYASPQTIQWDFHYRMVAIKAHFSEAWLCVDSGSNKVVWMRFLSENQRDNDCHGNWWM